MPSDPAVARPLQPGPTMRALLIAAIVSVVVSCGDDVAETPDAGGPDAGAPDAGGPATVWEHMVAAGDWIQDFRMRELGCVGCRAVARFELVPDEECGCVRMTVHLYWDVVATDDALGLADGDERCAQVFDMNEQLIDGIDPTVRSVVDGTLTSSTCPGGGVGQLSLLFDGQQRDASGRPGIVALLQPFPANPFWHVAGYPTDEDDLQNAAVPLVRCADADRVAGREYCMPACDWPGSDPGRTECGFPDYEDPPFYDLGCAGDPHPTTAPDPLVLTGEARAYGTGAAVVGATAEAHLVDDELLLASTTTADDGTFSMPYATGGTAVDIFVKVTAAGYRDGYDFFFEALVNHANVFPLLFTQAETDAFAAAVGVTLVPDTGAMIVHALDCGGTRIPGAVITVPAAAGATVVYLDEDGAPDLALTATSGSATAVILDVPPGVVDVMITAGDVTYTARPARAFAGATSTQFRTP
jgi:hypothetical protein